MLSVSIVFAGLFVCQAFDLDAAKHAGEKGAWIRAAGEDCVKHVGRKVGGDAIVVCKAALWGCGFGDKLSDRK